MMRDKCLLIGVLLLFTFCHNNNSTANGVTNKGSVVGYSNTTYVYDIVGDRASDTLVLCNNETNPTLRDIYLCNGGVKERIISIRPWRDSTFVLTNPPIESVYLEATESENGITGFRIIIRNVAVAPDCMFIDLYHDDTRWVVGKYYLLNTLPNFGVDLFIKCVTVERPLIDVFGEALVCDPVGDIELEYWSFLPEIDYK